MFEKHPGQQQGMKKFLELHIFDFDGTLFNSPAPNVAQLERLNPNKGGVFYQELISTVDSHGYGWFQSLHTLEPPVVPKKPSISQWYVTPVLNHLKGLVEEDQRAKASWSGESQAQGDSGSSSISSSSSSPVAPSLSRLFFVLTGRDRKFTSRIKDLLDEVHVLSSLENVFLKPSECYGTVKFKLEIFSELIRRYRPGRVWYYEDRPEQGGQLVNGIQCLQRKLYDSRMVDLQGVDRAVNSTEKSVVLTSDTNTKGFPCMETTVCTTRIFPFTDKKGVDQTLPGLSLPSLFKKRSTVEHSMRYAERWADNYLKELRGEGTTSKKHPESVFPPDHLEVSAVDFKPFEFFLVLIDPKLSLRSEMMLSDEGLQEVIKLLSEERHKKLCCREV